jgi:beta-phosphoglucomutase-like phosphatase (HAD superfamily)
VPTAGEPGLVLFDFDGTIADTEQLVLEATNALADEFGCRIERRAREE